jgi:hypothetical protein
MVKELKMAVRKLAKAEKELVEAMTRLYTPSLARLRGWVYLAVFKGETPTVSTRSYPLDAFFV